MCPPPAPQQGGEQPRSRHLLRNMPFQGDADIACLAMEDGRIKLTPQLASKSAASVAR